MKKLLVLLASMLSLGACSDARFAERMLSDAGYTNIKTDGTRVWNGCPEEDNYVTQFSAISPNGRTHVTGVVCQKWPIGGGFIRLD